MSKEKVYTCQFDWQCDLHASDSGGVSAEGDRSETAFFEAYPEDTIVCGNGVTIIEAERSAWEKWQRMQQCSNHEFERGKFTDGSGFCKHCGRYRAGVFEPTTLCVICGQPTTHTYDTDWNYYCETHEWDQPLDKWRELDYFYAYKEYLLATSQRDGND